MSTEYVCKFHIEYALSYGTPKPRESIYDCLREAEKRGVATSLSNRKGSPEYRTDVFDVKGEREAVGELVLRLFDLEGVSAVQVMR